MEVVQIIHTRNKTIHLVIKLILQYQILPANENVRFYLKLYEKKKDYQIKVFIATAVCIFFTEFVYFLFLFLLKLDSASSKYLPFDIKLHLRDDLVI